jgi:hypothetical protein
MSKDSKDSNRTIELLVSADLLVEDADSAVRAYVDRLGFAEPEASWWSGGDGHGFRVVFLRAQRSVTAAPTRIEIMEPRSLDLAVPAPATLPHMPELFGLQQDWPSRTHGTVFATATMDEHISAVQKLGTRHWLDAANDVYPHHRLWFGVTEEEKGHWIPGDDGGLLIELVEFGILGPKVGASLHEPDPTPWDDLAPEALVRVRARRWLVPDLGESRRRLAEHVGIDSSEPVEARGLTWSRISPRHPRSATVDLVEPAPGTADADLVRKLGSVPDRIVIEVCNLDAKAEDLVRRGTPATRTTDPLDGIPAIEVDRDSAGGTAVSFVQASRPARRHTA